MSWVFGYGSLMWRPAFEHRARFPATLQGWRREFCRLSLRHRGTQEAPGMVVGLSPGGTCRGYAYELDPAHERDVLDYLDEREGAGYKRVALPLDIDGSQRAFRATAWVYVPEVAHPSHAPGLSAERIVELIATGRGQSGTAHNYLVALVGELERLGAADATISELAEAVEEYKKGAEEKARAVTRGPAASSANP